MKKFAIAVAVLVLLTGCGKNYLAEREFWKAEQALNKIKRSQLQAQGPEILTPVIGEFRRVYEKYPATIKAVESLFVIANLSIRQKNYDAAAESLGKVIRDYNHLEDRIPEALYGLAGLHELQDKWPEAEKVYWDAAERFPYHQKGLYAPIHIILHYKKAKDQQELDRVYAKTADHYQRLMKDTGPIQAGAAVKNYYGLAELSYGNWQKAREMWNQIHTEFPDSPYAPLSLLASGELSWKKQDYGSSMEAYETYLKDYPKHPLVKRVYIQMGAILDAQRNFGKAREWYDKGLAATGNDPAASADIKLLMARSYQKEGNWEKSEALYKQIETEHKDSTAALQIPFLYAAHYEAAGETDKAHTILNDAIQRYQGLSEGGNTRLAAYAERLQNAAIAEKGDWQQLLGNFDRKMARETTQERKGNWFFLKAVVTENRLQNRAAALELYKSFLNQYPNHPLTELAKTRQDSLLQQA